MNEEIKAASVDTPEFRKLLAAVEIASEADESEGALSGGEYTYPAALSALIAHINAWADERCNQLAASRAMLPVTDSQIEEVWFAVQRDWNPKGSQHRHVAFARAVLALASPVAGWVSVEKPLKADDVEWVVNDNAELGVKIGNQFFFLYKGDSLVYGSGQHDDGTPMMWREVGKREFGECCYPVKFYKDGAALPKRYTDTLEFTPGLSFGKPEDANWKPLPPAPVVTPTQQNQQEQI